jgi:hypothetical protein
MSGEWSDDDIARVIGNRAIKHLKMYPNVYAATGPSCRLSLRNHIRNDIAALLKAMRGDNKTRHYISTLWPDADTADEASPPELPAPPAPAKRVDDGELEPKP